MNLGTLTARHWPADLGAGLTTAVMLVPQAMAYAMLAGLEPVVGLYASILPLVLYALWGSSRQLAVGPVAMVSILVATAIAEAGAAGPGEAASYALVLAAMVGVVQVLLGVLRLGFVVDLLSHPVISGFTSGAAVLIGLSQLKHLLGAPIPRSHHVHELIAGAVAHAGETILPTVLLGAGAVVLLVALKRWAPRWPRALIVVVLGTLAAAPVGLGLVAEGVATVGVVPGGLPTLTVPDVTLDGLPALIPAALIIALIGFMESYAVARSFAKRDGHRVDPNRELLGLGAANLGAAATGGYPVAGGFARTAVNAQAGARSQLAAVVTAAIVAIVLVALMPLFEHLPKAVLAAIIITAVSGLIDVAEIRHLVRQRSWSDVTFWAATCVGTLVLGIELGIALGVTLSVLWLMWRISRPHLAELGRIAGTTQYRKLDNHPDCCERIPGLVLLRVDRSLYFANAARVLAAARRMVAAAPQPVRALIVDASAINDIDASGLDALRELNDELAERHASLHLARLKRPLRERLATAGLLAELGLGAVHDALHQAVLSLTAGAPPLHQDMKETADVS